MRDTLPIRLNEPADRSADEETDSEAAETTSSAKKATAAPALEQVTRARRALAPAPSHKAPAPLSSTAAFPQAPAPKQAAARVPAHAPAGGPTVPKGTAEKPRGSPAFAAQLRARAQAAWAARTEAQREINREAQVQARAAMVARAQAEREADSAAADESGAERSPKDTATLTLDPSTFVQVSGLKSAVAQDAARLQQGQARNAARGNGPCM